MNRVILIGRLTKDPELKFTTSGTAVTTFTIAINRKYKRDGQPEADFVPIVVWGKTAENTANYMSKGSLIGINGRIEVRSYEAKDGTRKYVTEVIGEEVEFLDSKNSKENHEHKDNSYLPRNSFSHKDEDFIPIDPNEDIPF